MTFASAVFSVREAAFLSDASMRFIYNELEQGVLREPARGIAKSVVGRDLVYLRCISPLQSGMTTALRRLIHRRIVSALRDSQPAADIETLLIPLAPAQDTIHQRLEVLNQARHDLIESVPGVAGGEPVVRGTRIPVRQIALLRVDGVSDAEFEADYGLSSEQVAAAVLYQSVYPSRGRPRRTAAEAS